MYLILWFRDLISLVSIFVDLLLKVMLSTIPPTLTMSFYIVQITTNFEKITLKFVVLSISLARTDTILNVVREITRLSKI